MNAGEVRSRQSGHVAHLITLGFSFPKGKKTNTRLIPEEMAGLS